MLVLSVGPSRACVMFCSLLGPIGIGSCLARTRVSTRDSRETETDTETAPEG